MGIQLLSISHKSAPVQVRSVFAFSGQQQRQILDRLMESPGIEEAVLLSTCNRMELYCSGEKDNRNLQRMQEILLAEAGVEEMTGIHDYIRRLQGERACHHLFLVAAGLDSAVLGEDQILGQVKQAYFYSQEHGFSKSLFNNLFRLAVTAAKRVKTDTVLSKTSVSTAGLALKKAEECFGGSLAGKRLLVIGASGQIGSIVVKDAMDIKELEIYVTVRKELPRGLHNEEKSYTVIPYNERYQWLDTMDVIISATASPHYTITKEKFLKHQRTDKKRVFFDLAVPLDIEEGIARLSNTFCYNMEDMQELARQNNERKRGCIADAEEIIKEYEEQFYKNLLYSRNMELVDAWKNHMVKEAETLGLEKALEHFFFGLREEADVEELRSFIGVLKRLQE